MYCVPYLRFAARFPICSFSSGVKCWYGDCLDVTVVISHVTTAYNFAEENFHELASNREIHKGFLPRKFPAIRYLQGSGGLSPQKLQLCMLAPHPCLPRGKFFLSSIARQLILMMAVWFWASVCMCIYYKEHNKVSTSSVYCREHRRAWHGWLWRGSA